MREKKDPKNAFSGWKDPSLYFSFLIL